MIELIEKLLEVTADLESWQILGIVNIEHHGLNEVTIAGDSSSPILHRQKSDVEFFGHEYIWQTTGFCGDDYSGYMLLPLENEKYLKLDFQC